MLCCDIACGFIYYGETRHRTKIVFDTEGREKVRQMFKEMHKYFSQRYTPKVKISKSCNACSLKNVCVPELNKNISAAQYISRKLKEEDG
ncbi:CRISPR/Cas system-associated exonuclease Cas4 (RecB family) [Catenibacillus scindens]|uniref:CRISPR/Cas system-associated exonuclease Cas4 (RecB family) n=1 Tax=Catenibacillus scindens TaxID=673271 RepID=A0A7W8H8B8_9FIRM|nr:CRISPR/Cas system-associated exonuclease Cas4 (RecB family) [Catenibacillus scindens]